VITAFPVAQGPSQNPSKAELASFMLPGFRFLFAAIVLSMSILVFGLGAAALLRAAHEEFANNPSWRAAPEATFAQSNEATKPVLAMLRVEPTPAEPKAPDNVPAVAPPAEPAASTSTPAEPERIAALKREDSSPVEAAKPEIPVAETSPPSESAPTQADLPAAADETKIAAVGQVLSPTNEALPATSEQTSAPASPDADIASTKIATLGDPPAAIETPPATVTSAKPDRSAIKKRLQARRAAQRRKIAQRARLARQATQQPATDPFAQPTITVRSR
jgi:hypothetical protein